MINLSPSAVEVLNVGGTAVETNNAASAMHPVIDVNANRITFNLVKGQFNGSQFSPGLRGSNIGVTLDANAGTWSATNGTSGPLTAAEITAVLNFIKNLRNGIETIAVNHGIFAGTQVAS